MLFNWGLGLDDIGLMKYISKRISKKSFNELLYDFSVFISYCCMYLPRYKVEVDSDNNENFLSYLGLHNVNNYETVADFYSEYSGFEERVDLGHGVTRVDYLTFETISMNMIFQEVSLLEKYDDIGVDISQRDFEIEVDRLNVDVCFLAMFANMPFKDIINRGMFEAKRMKKIDDEDQKKQERTSEVICKFIHEYQKAYQIPFTKKLHCKSRHWHNSKKMFDKMSREDKKILANSLTCTNEVKEYLNK